MLPDEQQHITSEDARGGSTPHIVRYVLVISLLLAVVGMGFLLLL